jgi:phenylpropionate dioxygenase-like ring-hydroxylating dioxygenase large terminal subunit
MGKVIRGELVCAYHAWRVNADGQVTSPSTPGTACSVPMLKTWERHGYLWVANADVPDSALPEFLEPGYRLIAGFTRRFDAPLKVVMDNFGEIEHAFQVHRFIGPNRKVLDSLTFTSEHADDETYGRMACRYRPLLLGFHRPFGIRTGDTYHNDWVFRFKPLHGSYRNYWTGPDKSRRPVSFIVTSFLVPADTGRVDVHVFVQSAIESRLLRLFSPLLNFITALIVQFEIKADADISRFAPDSDAQDERWHLTHLDRQVTKNRQLFSRHYIPEESVK